ncbi:uncharacterized protein [Lolium perenne]|uniref:uncharacterized protein n=1 Tax=Lolium perenne TaxID=4522 RepID=UPI0021EACF12|nr:uncharacterized protein LOC127323447 [Lolium perenne]
MAAKVAAPLPFRHDVRGPLGWRSPRSGLPGALAGLDWRHSTRRLVEPARARGRNNKSGGRGATKDDERSEELEEPESVLLIDGEEDEEFEDGDLSGFRGLVLDLSYRPVNVVCWKRAICLEFTEKADVLEYYDQTVSSPSGSFYIPAVLRVPQLLQVMKRRRVKQCLSRKNILYRDDFTCQYCPSEDDLTIDHVIPTSRGGKWEWENLVTACSRCNSRKGNKTLLQANMKLRKIPKAPKEFDIIAVPLTKSAFRTIRRRQGLPEEWLQYIAGSSP